MLKSNQLKEIRELNFFYFSFCDSPEKKKEFTVPNFFQIKELLLQKLKYLGISKIECTQPYKANCIIRVFQSLDYKYENETISLYGLLCYTKKSQTWTTRDNIKIDFSKCDIGVWYFQDECVHVDCDFYDCFVKIS